MNEITEQFRAEQRVLYGDTDSMGVAYYANYLRWFEIGRTELFRRVGSTYRLLEEQGCFLPVYEAYCRYHNPAVLAEGYTVHVCTDRDGKVLKPPVELKQLLKEMEEIAREYR